MTERRGAWGPRARPDVLWVPRFAPTALLAASWIPASGLAVRKPAMAMLALAMLAMTMLWITMLSGCAATKGGQWLGIPAAEAAALARTAWLESKGELRFKLSGVMEYRGREFGVLSFVLVEPSRRRLHCQTMNEMGVTLFELRVAGSGAAQSRVFPGLDRIPGFKELMADALRRVFLAAPGAIERASMNESRLMIRDARGRRYVFDRGRGALLKVESREERWVATYADHTPIDTVAPPGPEGEDAAQGPAANAAPASSRVARGAGDRPRDDFLLIPRALRLHDKARGFRIQWQAQEVTPQ